MTDPSQRQRVRTPIYLQSLPTRSRREPMPMVSPGGSSDDGGASAAAAVCCMCGDQGLPGELFQCAICLHRLQHRYCSDQYPRMAAYSICNWCLRDKEVGDGSPSVAKALTARAKQRASSSSSRLNGSRAHHEDKDEPCAGSGGCSRSAFPAEPQKPVKKPKKRHERAAAQRPAAATKGREVQTGGARTTKPLVVRAKARVPRYKLLTEVIGCQ